MKCLRCEEIKLSNEFPPETVREDCRHPPLVCLRCTIRHVKEKKTCPYPQCTIKDIDPECQQMQWFEAILKTMFVEYTPTQTKPPGAQESSSNSLNITLLNGQTMSMSFDASLEIVELKKKIEKKWKHEKKKQKLLYHGKTLEDEKPDGTPTVLSDFNVEPGTIHLVLFLTEIPKALNRVVFDLFWKFPGQDRDYLDATCFIFKGQEFLEFFDYRKLRKKQYCQDSIEHSGDEMDDVNKIGHHKIMISLTQIPAFVSHMVFTLSDFRYRDMSKFPRLKLNVYNPSDEEARSLCNTEVKNIRNVQAVVMCYVTRNKQGAWEVFNCETVSKGNAEDYDPLQKTISEIIGKITGSGK